MPDANRLTIHVMAAVGEHELEMIAQRTTAGLAAAKARGVKLGNPRQAAANRQGADRARLGEAVAERRQPRGRAGAERGYSFRRRGLSLAGGVGMVDCLATACRA
jgi:DNA invertase Pin-like site-specific DNA recombinase